MPAIVIDISGDRFEPGPLLYPVASKVFRTGKQTLYQAGDLWERRVGDPRWFVRLENRTNDTWVQIPREKVPAWVEALDGDMGLVDY